MREGVLPSLILTASGKEKHVREKVYGIGAQALLKGPRHGIFSCHRIVLLHEEEVR